MSNRRGQGEGSIRERPNGRWEARYRDTDGRPRSIYAATRREAVERLRVALTQREQGIRRADSRLTVDAFLNDWLEAQRQRIRPRTHESYTAAVRLYVRPAIDDIPLAKLQPEHVARMVAGLSARRNLSPTTVRYAYSVIRTPRSGRRSARER